MLTQKPTEKMIAEWKEIYRQYKDKVFDNRKSVEQIFYYINSKYTVSKFKVLGRIQSYCIERDEKSKTLYDSQDEVFKQCEKILFYFTDDPVKGFCNVEGSNALWDEVLAFRGLDETDIKNYYLVAEYIKCLKQYDQKNPILKPE